VRWPFSALPRKAKALLNLAGTIDDRAMFAAIEMSPDFRARVSSELAGKIINK